MKTLKFLSIISIAFLLFACSGKDSAGDKESAMNRLFTSEQTLRDGIVGKCIASEDNNCLIKFTSSKRAKIYVKESSDPGYTQFQGRDYKVTYLKDDLCVEFPRKRENDNIYYATLTADEFTLNLNSKIYRFRNLRIITASEVEQLYDSGGGQTNSLLE